VGFETQRFVEHAVMDRGYETRMQEGIAGCITCSYGRSCCPTPRLLSTHVTTSVDKDTTAILISVQQHYTNYQSANKQHAVRSQKQKHPHHGRFSVSHPPVEVANLQDIVILQYTSFTIPRLCLANHLKLISGLGALLSTTFAKEGANIAINYFNRIEPAQKVQEECQELGVKAMMIKAVCRPFPSLNTEWEWIMN
jgi:hypothetical protein